MTASEMGKKGGATRKRLQRKTPPRRQSLRRHAGDVREAVRKAFADAMHELHMRGKPLHIILADAFQDQPLKTLEACSRFLPVESKVQVTGTHELHLNAVRELAAIEVAKTQDMIDVTPTTTDVEDVDEVDPFS